MRTKPKNDIGGLSIDQAAVKVNVSSRTIERAIQTKKLPVIKIGAYTRIEEKALADYQNSL